MPDRSTLNRFRNRLMQDGFAALAEFDDNGDGKIDAQDAVFEQLGFNLEVQRPIS